MAALLPPPAHASRLCLVGGGSAACSSEHLEAVPRQKRLCCRFQRTPPSCASSAAPCCHIRRILSGCAASVAALLPVPARTSRLCLVGGALLPHSARAFGLCRVGGSCATYDDLSPHPRSCLNRVCGVFLLSSRDPLGSRRRAVWLLVGHTHSESPAGVSGLSRLPSPVLSRWVVTIVTGPGTKVRRTFVTATYFNRLLATSTRILATLSCTSSKIAAAISDCRILDFSSSKIATSSIANCCS